MLVNRTVILAGIESSYGVDPTLTGADAILVENPSWANEGLRMSERPSVRTSIGKLQSIYGGRLMSVTFDVEIKGSGTAGTAPELGVLLRACSMGETVVASTSVTYALVSTGQESITLYFYIDGKRRILTGCHGNVSTALEVGAQGKMSFTFIGHVAAETDTAIVTPTYNSTVPVAAINASFSIGSYAAVIDALNFDLGNTVAMPPNINAADGYGDIIITARDVSGSFSPEDVLVATNAFEADFLAGNTMALTTGTIGSSAGNRYAITAPAVYYSDTAKGDRDGVATLEQTCGFAETSATNDEISIAFT